MKTKVMIGSSTVLKDAEILAAEAISNTFSQLYACSDVEENTENDVEIIQVEGVIPQDNEASDVEVANAIAKILSTETTDEEKKEAVSDLVENVVTNALEDTGEISDENAIKEIAELLADKVEDAIEENMEDNIEPSEDVVVAEESCKESGCSDKTVKEACGSDTECVEDEVSEVSYVAPGMEDKAALLAKQREEVRKKLEMEKAIAKDRGVSNYQANIYMKKGTYASSSGEEEGDDYIAAETSETDIEDESYEEGCGHSKWDYINKAKAEKETDDEYSEAVPGESGYEPEEATDVEPIEDDGAAEENSALEADDTYEEAVAGVSGYKPEPMFDTKEDAE